MKSNFLRLNLTDIGRGLLMAVLGAGVTALYEGMNNANGVDWKVVGGVAAAAGLSYLIKNVFTNSKDQLLRKERK